MNADRRNAILALAFLTLVWGLNWVVIKASLDRVGALDFAVLRSVLGAAFMFLGLGLLRYRVLPSDWKATAALGLLQTTGFMGLVCWSLLEGAAGRNAVLAYTMPFWVVLFGWPFLDERPDARRWVVIVLAAVGLLTMLWPMLGGAALLPALLALAAGACWGGAVVVAKRMHLPRSELGAVTAWQMLIGAVPLAVASFWFPQPEPVWDRVSLGGLLYNVIPANALAWLLWLFVLRQLSASASSLASLAVPVVGVLAAAVILGERPGAHDLAGMALVVAALGLLTREGIARLRAGVT